MNSPFDPRDPVLQALANEETTLPAQAAAEARRVHRLRARRRRWVGIAGIMLLGALGMWLLARGPHGRGRQPELASNSHPPGLNAPAARASGFVKAQTVEEAQSESLPPPAGMNEEQKALLEAAHGLPLLLVRDDTGRPTRIHVIER